MKKVDLEALPHAVRTNLQLHAEHDRAINHMHRNPRNCPIGKDPQLYLTELKRLRLRAKELLAQLGYSTDGTMLNSGTTFAAAA